MSKNVLTQAKKKKADEAARAGRLQEACSLYEAVCKTDRADVEAWVKLGGFTSVNRSVPPETYPDPVSQAVAKALVEARISRFGAGDSMPASLQRAWWDGILELVKDPSKLDSILSSLTDAAKNAK